MTAITVRRDGDKLYLVGEWPRETILEEQFLCDCVDDVFKHVKLTWGFGEDTLTVDFTNGKAVYSLDYISAPARTAIGTLVSCELDLPEVKE